MRTIKFRIWDKGNNRWFHGSTDEESIKLQTDAINLFGEVIIMGEILRDQNDDKMISLERLKDLVACQFTGLKDKNGKEIFEGDILNQKTGRDYSEIRFVEFRDGAFRFKEQNTPHQGFIYSNPGTEVIGNIYENKELLEAKK